MLCALRSRNRDSCRALDMSTIKRFHFKTAFQSRTSYLHVKMPESAHHMNIHGLKCGDVHDFVSFN